MWNPAGYGLVRAHATTSHRRHSQLSSRTDGRRLFIIAIVIAAGTILAPGRPAPFLHELGSASVTLGLVLDVPKICFWLADIPELKILNIQSPAEEPVSDQSGGHKSWREYTSREPGPAHVIAGDGHSGRHSPRRSARIHAVPAIAKVSAFSLQFV